MRLRGVFRPPGDKSVSHRLALLPILGRGRCRVTNYAPGQDCASSLGAASALGCLVQADGEAIVIEGAGGAVNTDVMLDCGNSGTTMRLLMGILAGLPGRWVLDGDASLSARPMERVAAPLRTMGARVETTQGHAPVTITGGGLGGASHRLPVASAQVKSALLLAGLNADGPTEVAEPWPSRDHTERLLRLMGARITGQPGRWRVQPGPLELPPAVEVPGDPSSAAFMLCAAALLPGSRVTAEGVMLNPGRAGFVEVLRRMGAAVEVEHQGGEPEPWGRVGVAHGPELKACQVEAAEVPGLVDEVPILALAATQAVGRSVFRGVAELRVKETDRLAAVQEQLGAMGARISCTDDEMVVEGPTPLRPAQGLDALGDHRMAMTLRLAGLAAGCHAPVAGAACAAVSWPGFNAELERLLA